MLHQRHCCFGAQAASPRLPASPSMAARTARAESIRPGDTVLLPAYAQSDVNGAHVGKVRFLLCVAWCVPRGLSAHLQPATGTQVHCDLTPPATTPGRAHSSSPVTSSSNPLRRFASRTCALVDLVPVPTQHAESCTTACTPKHTTWSTASGMHTR